MVVDKLHSLRELIQGIDSLLQKHRSTFSDDEIALLHNLRDELQKQIAENNSLSAFTALRVLEVLTRLFGMLDYFKD